MKINPPVESPVVQSAATALSGKNAPAQGVLAKSAASSKETTTSGVAVTVSSAARALSAGATSTSDVDMAKVRAVKSAIAQGTYQVNPGVIADKLLSNAQEMLQRSRA
ncbi:MAG: hypothetical protein OHK0048_09380 [Rhodoferax sp.]